MKTQQNQTNQTNQSFKSSPTLWGMEQDFLLDLSYFTGPLQKSVQTLHYIFFRKTWQSIH